MSRTPAEVRRAAPLLGQHTDEVLAELGFTPEKIETWSDRLGQVYRAKVRILEGVERFQPGQPQLVEIGHDEDAVHDRDAKQRYEADRRGDAEDLPG